MTANFEPIRRCMNETSWFLSRSGPLIATSARGSRIENRYPYERFFSRIRKWRSAREHQSGPGARLISVCNCYILLFVPQATLAVRADVPRGVGARRHSSYGLRQFDRVWRGAMSSPRHLRALRRRPRTTTAGTPQRSGCETVHRFVVHQKEQSGHTLTQSLH